MQNFCIQKIVNIYEQQTHFHMMLLGLRRNILT